MKKGRQDRIAETLTILSAGIYVFSAMAVYFPASSEFSLCTCVLFTFRPLGTLKDFFQSERFRGINSSARMPMNKAFAERLKLLKDFWSNSSGGAYFLPEEEYAHRKEHKKTQETGMPDILLQDAANLVRSFSQSCGKLR